MNKKIYAAGLMSLALILGGSTAFANANCEMMKHGGEGAITGVFFMKAHCILRSSDKLALTEEQEKTIRDLKIDIKKTVIRQQAEGQILDMDIFLAMKPDKIDSTALQALLDQKYEGEKVQAKTIANAYVKLTEILTGEQWKTLTTIEKEKMMEWDKGGSEANDGHNDYSR